MVFGLFKPRAPLDPWEKAWTEDRFCRMADDFGMQRLLETPTLLPDERRIPAATNQHEVEALVDFVQHWMQVDCDVRVEVAVAGGEISSNETEGQTKVAIVIPDSLLGRKEQIIAITARTLSPVALSRCSWADDAWSADLFPAYCGLGVFAANHVLRESGKSDGLSWWSTLQRGYLPARIFGYAMALRHWVRSGDSDQGLGAQLRLDAATTFEDATKYLAKTQESVFRRELLTKPRSSLSEAALLDELRSGTPAREIAAIWTLQERSEAMASPPALLEDLLVKCLRSKEPDVRAEAAGALPLVSTTTESLLEISDALKDRHDRVRIAAASSLSHFAGHEDESQAIQDLTDALQDDVRLVVLNAAKSLTKFGPAAEPALKKLLQRLRRSFNECNTDESHTILWAMRSITGDTEKRLREFFGETDSEYLQQALELLEAIQDSA